MVVRNTALRYGSVAMTLHWFIAALLVLNICLGLYMTNLPRSDPGLFAIFQFHKSVGLTVLLLSLMRLLWRLTNPVPRIPVGSGALIRTLAKTSHALLYFFIIAVPLSGWLMVSASSIGLGTPYFGLFHVPDVPFLASLPRAQRKPYHELFETVHVWLAWATIALVPVHMLAALYHQFIRRDDVLKRMLPGTDVRDRA